MTNKKKKETVIGLAKESVGLGVTSMAGMGAIGAMGAIPGMPSQASNVSQAAGAGLTLLNVGQAAKVGMALPRLMEGNTPKKKSGNKYVDKII